VCANIHKYIPTNKHTFLERDCERLREEGGRREGGGTEEGERKRPLASQKI
jgi:hypothetical protein